MEKKFCFGIIGGGMWGKKHIETLQKTKRAEVRWIASRTEATVEEVKKKYDIPYGSCDYTQMLDDPKVDAVIVTPPPYLHAEMGIAVLKAGKHLLIEKPMVANKKQLKEFLSEVEKHKDLIILEASARHTRLQPKFGFIKNIIDSGKLGEIYYIHHNHLGQTTFVEYNPKGKWGVDKKLAGGGPFLDWGVYDLSFHLGILSDKPKIKKVSSFTRNDLRDLSNLAPKSDVEQHGVAFLEFDTGLKYYYERGAGVHCETPNETRIYGTKGGLKFRFPTWESNEIEYFHTNEKNQPVKEILKVDMSKYSGDDNEELINHFLDCLEGKDKPIMTPHLAAKHLDILFQIV